MPDAPSTQQPDPNPHPAPGAAAPIAAPRAPVTEGRVVELIGDQVVLKLPGTDYRLHLLLEAGGGGGARPSVGAKLTGRIAVDAQRLDRIPAGGTYIEPCFGRPRRLQGRVLGVDEQKRPHRLLVSCGGALFACTLTDKRQNPADFPTGHLVSFDVERGARFEPMG